jgi:hypothetical protein
MPQAPRAILEKAEMLLIAYSTHDFRPQEVLPHARGSLHPPAGFVGSLAADISGKACNPVVSLNMHEIGGAGLGRLTGVRPHEPPLRVPGQEWNSGEPEGITQTDPRVRIVFDTHPDGDSFSFDENSQPSLSKNGRYLALAGAAWLAPSPEERAHLDPVQIAQRTRSVAEAGGVRIRSFGR